LFLTKTLSLIFLQTGCGPNGPHRHDILVYDKKTGGYVQCAKLPQLWKLQTVPDTMKKRDDPSIVRIESYQVSLVSGPVTVTVARDSTTRSPGRDRWSEHGRGGRGERVYNESWGIIYNHEEPTAAISTTQGTEKGTRRVCHALSYRFTTG
jgi:hypothetical protein